MDALAIPERYDPVTACRSAPRVLGVVAVRGSGDGTGDAVAEGIAQRRPPAASRPREGSLASASGPGDPHHRAVPPGSGRRGPNITMITYQHNLPGMARGAGAALSASWGITTDNGS